MKKFIQSSLILFALVTTIVMNGCDAFESFIFSLPVSFVIDADGQNNPSGSESYCLEEDDTYQDYKDKLNSIVFVEAYMTVIDISPDTDIQGSGSIRLYEGVSPDPGNELFVHTTPGALNPQDYKNPNFYKIELTQEQVDNINASLAEGNRCFYGEYEVTANLTNPVTMQVKVDILFNMDADL